MSDELLEAIQTRDVDRVGKLLGAGADPNQPGKSRYGGGAIPPLEAAIDELQAFEAIDPYPVEPPGPIESVVLLLRYGARATGWGTCNDEDPLLYAVSMNHIEAVRLLLAAGADPNVRDHRRDSPLNMCAENGHLEMARLLLLCGATKTIDEWGGDRPMTALGLAARDLQVDMVKLLLAFGANPQARDVDDCTPLDCLELNESSDDPVSQARLQEIRALLEEAGAKK